jgi:hypothetical protein
VALALSGCSGGSGPTPTTTAPSTTATPTTTTTVTETTTATTSPSPTPSLPSGFALTQVTSPAFPAVNAAVVGVAVRVGRHDAYDRVVYEFSGTGRPGFRVRYVSQPIGDPSGDPVDVLGAAYLEVVVTGLSYPEAGDPQPSEVGPSALAGTAIAQSGVLFGGFEGMGQTFIGVRDHRRAFRAFALTGPPRLVVDLAHG